MSRAEASRWSEIEVLIVVLGVPVDGVVKYAAPELAVAVAGLELSAAFVWAGSASRDSRRMEMYLYLIYRELSERLGVGNLIDGFLHSYAFLSHK